MKSEETTSERYPDIDSMSTPLGARVLVQVASPVRRSKGGIILVDETQQSEKDNITVAKIVKLGNLAFRHRQTGAWWPEHDPEAEGSIPIEAGMFVRVPRYGGDRWRVEVGEQEAYFVLFEDTDIRSLVTGDPEQIKSYY